MTDKNGQIPAKIVNSTTNVHSYLMTVRDYEMDAYGVVNHATYLSYMEEARKAYLSTLGFNFKELLLKKVGFVVISVELDYLRPLVGGDEIDIETKMCRLSKLKFQFSQNIFMRSTKQPVVKAVNMVVPVNSTTGRPQWPDELEALLSDFQVKKNSNQISKK